MTIIRQPTPKFGINEIVYSRESAVLGYIESMKVSGIRFDPQINANFYIFTFNKERIRNQTAGDFNDLRSSSSIELIESDLLSFCEALAIKKDFLINELNKTNVLMSRCPGNTTSG